MKILILNSGSSSLKIQVIKLPEEEVICVAAIGKIGSEESEFKYEAKGKEKIKKKIPIANHAEGLNEIASLILSSDHGVIASKSDLSAIGHRVVHGGEVFKKTRLINEEVKKQIELLAPLAPLHNPANLNGIEVAEEIFEGIPQYAVFDTAFHSSIPAVAYRFPVPNNWYDDFGVRVYGFHGTSHKYVYEKAVQYLGFGEQHRVITLHLGNGCSMTAIKDGKSIDTSMGLGPLSGLMMGTRSGDIDPSIIFYLTEQGHDIADIKHALNNESGMKGMAGDNDLRVVEDKIAKGDEAAQLALDVYNYRLKKYIGSYIALLGGVDAIVFTGGVGENDESVRKGCLEGLDFLGIQIDLSKNQGRFKELTEIHSGSVPVLIIPTNEELAIAKESKTVI